MNTRRVTRCLVPSAATLLLVSCGGSTGTDAGHDTHDAGTNATRPTIQRFVASRETASPSCPLELSWTVRDADSVTIQAGSTTVLAGSTRAEGTLEARQGDASTVFTLSAKRGDDVVQKAITVALDAGALCIRTFVANPNPAPEQGATTLSWDVTGADTVRIDDGNGASVLDPTATLESSIVVDLAASSVRFVLKATKGTQTEERELLVTTTTPAVIDSFRASPMMFDGASVDVTLAWRARGSEITLRANGSEVSAFPKNATTGTITISIADTTTFELRAVGAGNTVTERRIVAKVVQEREPNDGTADANPIVGGVLGEIATSTDADFFAFDVPAGASITAETSDGAGGCAFDTLLALYDANGVPLAEDDDGGTRPCSKIDANDAARARDMPAGRYFLAVSGYQGTSTGTYLLTLVIDEPRCGNGRVETLADELCDDGNTASGDGCSTTCELELQGTIGGPGAERTFAGAIDPPGDVDVYEITLTSPGYIFAETGVPEAGRCDMTAGDTTLELIDSSGRSLALNDDAAGFAPCSRIDTGAALEAQPLDTGTYYIAVEAYGATSTIAAYELVLRTTAPGCGNDITEPGEECDDGNTGSGDGCSSTCALEDVATIRAPGGSASFALSGLRDIGRIAIEIGESGQSITASVSDGAGHCGIGTDLTLVEVSSGRQLGRAPFDPQCTVLDPMIHGFSANLDPGRYYLLVESLESTPGTVVVDVGIVDPKCGNRILETKAAEACDDGNESGGDGCSAICRFEGSIVEEGSSNETRATATDSTATIGGGIAIARGSITPVADIDHFSFTIPAGRRATLRAETYSVFGVRTCGGDSDTLIELFDSAGGSLARDDDDGDGLCSLIDGSGTSPRDSGAARLDAGTYTIAVTELGDDAIIGNYFLDIRLE